MKVSKTQFEEAIRATGGLYSESVKYIKKKWKIDINRTSVKERAENSFPELLKEVREAAKDKAEAVLNKLMDSKREDIQFKAATYALDRLATDRGYNPKSNVDHTTNGKDMQVDFTKYTFEQLEQLSKGDKESSKD
jgi:hypothetical protein